MVKILVENVYGYDHNADRNASPEVVEIESLDDLLKLVERSEHLALFKRQDYEKSSEYSDVEWSVVVDLDRIE